MQSFSVVVAFLPRRKVRTVSNVGGSSRAYRPFDGSMVIIAGKKTWPESLPRLLFWKIDTSVFMRNILSLLFSILK